ncbi:MAG: FKBP-type peptidyl-prolyl cis-trans isomerase [Gemmatimonadaceae bacterium]|nr:FKBP-type peptidyl-prolyl cis-trans isomerase [Gemmatimonadaceae bacterium]
MPPAVVRSRRPAATFAVLAAAALQGCSIDSKLPEYTDPATLTYATSTGVTSIAAMTRVNAQVYTQDITAGTGRTVVAGDSIATYYSGRLSGGYQFDSRARPSTPYIAVLDTTDLVRGVIKGWINGIAGMKVGGTRRIVIGPESAYRFSTVRDEFNTVIIPPNSVLVFEVEVTDAAPRQ